jgi:hypothetical protein
MDDTEFDSIIDIPLLPRRQLDSSLFQCKIRVHGLQEMELRQLPDWEELVDGLDERELVELLEDKTIPVGRTLHPVHNVTTLLRRMEPREMEATECRETILEEFSDVEAFLGEVSKRGFSSKVVFAVHPTSTGPPTENETPTYIARFLYDPCFYLPRRLYTEKWKITVRDFRCRCEGANCELEEWTKDGFPSCFERSPGRRRCYLREDELVECPGGLMPEIRNTFKRTDGLNHTEAEVVKCAPRIAVLAGEPGAGKSTLLNKLRHHFAEEGFWTVWIELKDWEGVENGGELWERLAPSEGDHPLVGPLLKHFMAKGKCALFLDGFDEAKDRGPALELVDRIQRSKARAVVATRTRLVRKLEDVTGAPAFSLVPLDSREKEDLLVRLWKFRQGPSVDPTAACRLLQEAKPEFDAFLANPLHLAMIAEVFRPDRPPPKYPTLYSLFQEFVDLKFDIYAREKTDIVNRLSVEEGKMLKAKMEEECGVLAVTGKTLHEEALARLGLVTDAKFVHESLREFFLAKMVLETMELEELLGDYLVKEERQAIRLLLEEKCRIRKLDWSRRKCCNSSPWDGDNSALHRVASEGLPKLTGLLLEGCPSEFLLGKDEIGETALGVAKGEALYAFLEKIVGRAEAEQLLLDTCFRTIDPSQEQRIRDANPTAARILDRYCGLRNKMKELLKNAKLGNEKGVRTILEGEDEDRLRKILLEGRDTHMFNTVLHVASGVEEGVGTVRVLLEKGASVDWRNRTTTGVWHSTPLHLAADPQVAEVLLEAGAKLNARNISGHIPLITAVIRKNHSLFEFLLNKSTEDEINNTKDQHGIGCVHWAAMTGIDFFVSLCDHAQRLGWDLAFDLEDRHGITPIIYAAKNSKWDVVEHLLDKNNIGINKKDCLGR